MSRRIGPGGTRGRATRQGLGTSAPGTAASGTVASAATHGAPPEVERGSRDRRAGRRARAWLWPLVRPHRRLVVLASAAVLVQTGASLAMPYLVRWPSTTAWCRAASRS